MNNIAYLSLGTNIGNRKNNLKAACNELRKNVSIDKISKVYETEPVHYENQDPFFNCGVQITCNQDPFELLKLIKLIEKKIGRVKTKKNDPRVCDIDIIDFNGLVKNNTLLKLPHPRSHSRNFVLYPIKEIDPKWVHPVFKKNVDFLINELSQNSRIEITRLRKSVII